MMQNPAAIEAKTPSGEVTALDRVVLRIAILCLSHAPLEVYDYLIRGLPEDELIALLELFAMEEATPEQLVQHVWDYDWRPLVEKRRHLLYRPDFHKLLGLT